ncbi:transposase [Solwaraspora sp. WMMD406]|nr:transposase [Solwaraspora sp. WMMD406]MDG4767766.1 transposase [Solwaraspora sp. WMMD406]
MTAKCLKGVSSRRRRQEFPDLVQPLLPGQQLWSGSYFAGLSAAHR